MRNCRLFLLLLGTLILSPAVEIAGQKPTPKPRVQKQFTSEEGGFTVKFPGVPRKSSRKFDSAFGKTTQTMFEFGTATSLYMVGLMDFPTVITDEAELDIRFDSVQEKISATPGFKLIDERRIYVDESLGREFEFEVAGFSMTMRVFMVRQRLFQLAVTTKGSISKGAAALRKLHEKKVAEFVDSFAATNLPEPTRAATELPADFQITVADGKFRSDFFGMTMELPKDSKVSNREFNEYIKQAGVDEARKEKPKTRENLEFSLRNTEILVSATMDDDGKPGLFMIAAERISFPNFLPSAVISNYVKSALEPGETVVKKASTVMLGKAEFAWVETARADGKSKMRFYAANRGGICLEIFFEYSSENQLAAGLAALESLKFDVPVENAK